MGVRGVKIRIKRNFGNYKAGQEFDWADGMARVMVARGLVEEVVAKAPQVEEATVQPVVERAEERHTKRPRK